MRAAHYAHALSELLKEEPKKEDQLIKHFFHVMEENGHKHLAKKVLRAFMRLRMRDEKKSTIEIITAIPITETEVPKLLKKEPFSRILANSHRRVVRVVDESIVGGVIVRTGSERIDQSYKRALTKLYEHITK